MKVNWRVTSHTLVPLSALHFKNLANQTYYISQILQRTNKCHKANGQMVTLLETPTLCFLILDTLLETPVLPNASH